MPCATPWIKSTAGPGKFLQLSNDKLVHAELALRFWHEHQNLYVWAPALFLYVELNIAALNIQEWQPRLNYPFMCHFCHPRKGILKKPAMNTNAQFGLATLWRRAKHKFTPQVVLGTVPKLAWTLDDHPCPEVEYKGSFWNNRDAAIECGGLTRCYALRRLGNNIQEPYRTLSLQAIDACIRWWRGKPAPRASALSTWATDGSLQHATGSYRCQDMLSRSGPSSVGLWEGSNVHVNQPATTTDSRLQGWNWLPRALSVLWMRSWMQHFH